MNLGWESNIDSDKWSAFVVENSNIPVDCAVVTKSEVEGSTDMNTESISCMNALEICLLQRTSFALSSPGSFWLSENDNLHTTLSSLRKNGVKMLRSKKK